MNSGAIQAEYRLMETRPRLLARFFEESRDNWKRKCQEAVAEVKQFRDTVRDVQQSRQMWRETLRLVDERPAEVLRHVTAERLEEKFGWLRQYGSQWNPWSEYQALLSHCVDEIRSRGSSQSAAYQVALRLGPQVRTDAGRQLKDELLTFIAGESAALLPTERLPGSSEALESAFGQLKSITGDHQTGGFTSLLLSLACAGGPPGSQHHLRRPGHRSVETRLPLARKQPRPNPPIQTPPRLQDTR